jgi:hypothetical protein
VDFQHYKAPLFLYSGHLQTIYPTLFRKVNPSIYLRERITTPDNDFLDLDWATADSQKLAILSHGLEGNSRRTYMVGMARAFNKSGWDALAWNFRTCSGEVNRQLRMYHSGTTDDLHTVITYALKKGYTRIVLIGFSMGGNQTLKYLAEYKNQISAAVTHAITFSVPCDLYYSSLKLAYWSNKIYMKRFLKLLKVKIQWKAKQYPDKVSMDGYSEIKNFYEFDDRYTAPVNGFKDAMDYYKQCSSKQFIAAIKIPTLIINALNDPFLSEECFPYQEVQENPLVKMETPRSGGHTGFVQFNKDKMYWSEKRALQFIET